MILKNILAVIIFMLIEGGKVLLSTFLMYTLVIKAVIKNAYKGTQCRKQ